MAETLSKNALSAMPASRLTGKTLDSQLEQLRAAGCKPARSPVGSVGGADRHLARGGCPGAPTHPSASMPGSSFPIICIACGPRRGRCRLKPVKRGLVEHPADWPFSSFHRCVDCGLYPDGGGA